MAQRTRAINALRGHAAEFGVVVAKGTTNIAVLLTGLADNDAITPTARSMFEQMGAHIETLDRHVAALDRQLLALHKINPVSQVSQ